MHIFAQLQKQIPVIRKSVIGFNFVSHEVRILHKSAIKGYLARGYHSPHQNPNVKLSIHFTRNERGEQDNGRI